MNDRKINNVYQFWAMLALLFITSIPSLAGAGTALPIPTGPLNANGQPATPDYYTTANWANSPPLAKFVDTLPRFGVANNLGKHLSVGKPDTLTYPGSDYYEIELVEFRQQMHTDLPVAGTLLRGYVQVNNGTNVKPGTLPSQGICGTISTTDACANTVAPDPVLYLGPTLISERDRPVRIKFTNRLPVGPAGDLFIPVDTSVMGAGTGPASLSGGRGQGVPCDNTVNGNTCASYTQNRADLHLHGGRTPWISDGTPHQWITPVEEITPFTKGVSLQNVPDMPDPGDGSTTYYYTNQQSARLMFYHDHAFGITRLNVYAGEAAGYVITDPHEQDLVARNLIPADQIPLIIQDKTYVDATLTDKITVESDLANPGTFISTNGIINKTTVNGPHIRHSDPLWNWGSGDLIGGVRAPVTGDLWMPHVYMPAQTLAAGFGGVNPFGRWMYGPWFYPATAVEKGPVPNPYYDADCSSPFQAVYANCTTPGQPTMIPGTPNTSMGMEAFQDSVVVNGTAFPTLTVDPRAYRFRVLNAASDRFQNLSFYVADSTDGTVLGTVSNISPDPRLNPGGQYINGRSNKTEVKMVPASPALAAANNWPALWPVDGRDGGVPDPGLCTGSEAAGTLLCPNLGPNFLQIGTEGGFLPASVTIKPQPVTYITDPTAFWVGIVDRTGLALGPAERADVIVDFSAYAGQTLILYNDAPAAWPARVAGYDYFTGAPDMRDSGGYGAGGVYDQATGAWITDPTNSANIPHGILPGYAPNTRTVMQVIVSNASAVPFVQTPLLNEFTAAAPQVGGVGGIVSTTGYVNDPPKTLFERAQEPIIVGQAAYKDAYPASYFPTNYPWEGINQINEQFLNFVTLAGEPLSLQTEPKGIHDEMGASFDPVYGRMSGNLAMQLPNPTTLNALLILYGFSDLPTETIKNSTSLNVEVIQGTVGTYPWALAPTDGTQIWKISHNGVDTHPIHFHIFDVQLINRVGWDGQTMGPEPNELGWKDTVKISPLMDTIVAVRPRAPALPFGIANSLRPLNPSIPIDSPMGFNSVDWQTGQARRPAVTNILYDFGWEYVWHCHILSHEEMDMMRPIVLNVVNTVPGALVQTTSPSFTGSSITVSWIDPTPAVSALGNISNEIGFKIERCAPAVEGGDCTFTLLATAIANSTTYLDTTATNSPFYNYRVTAFNAAGASVSNIVKTKTSDNIAGVCGASNGGVFIIAPTANLCSAGLQTVVTGTGPWSWSCTPINSGATATCSANLQQYVLSFNAGANGTLTGAVIQSVFHGANATPVTAVPNTGYQFVSWTNSANAIAGLLPTFTALNVLANEFYTANFYIPKDFNNDGNVDILWTNTTNNTSRVWFMNNLTKLAETALPAAPGAGFSIVATGDFNNDGHSDILYRNPTTGQNILYYMNGVNKLSQVSLPSITNSAATNWIIVGTGDFDGDGKTDILWRNTISGQQNVWYMDGNIRKSFAFLPAILANSASTNWIIVGVADFNGDGKPDILWRNTMSGQQNVWYMDGINRTSFAFLPATLINSASTNWIIVGIADFNRDGKPDILWRNTMSGQQNIWYMDGINRTSFAFLPTTQVGANWQIVGK